MHHGYRRIWLLYLFILDPKVSESAYDFLHNNSIYKIVTSEAVSVTEAEKRCNKIMQGTLAVIDDQEELKAISSEVLQTLCPYIECVYV